MSTQETQIMFSNVGKNDHLPYSKADIIKVSRVSENISISFYQLDYQAMAVNLSMPTPIVSSGKLPTTDGSEFLMPIGKIILDKNGFKQLIKEIEQIKKLMADEK